MRTVSYVELAYLAAILAALILGGRMLYRMSGDVHDVAEYARFRMAIDTAGTRSFDPDKYLRDLAKERAAQSAVRP